MKEEEIVKEEKEEITPNKENNENKSPLFSSLKWNNNNDDKDKENKNPLFSGNLFVNKIDNNNVSLFGKKEDNNNNEMKEGKNKQLVSDLIKVKKNNPPPLFGNNDNKDNKVSSNINEEYQLNISLNTGSLVTKNNPYLILDFY